MRNAVGHASSDDLTDLRMLMTLEAEEPTCVVLQHSVALPVFVLTHVACWSCCSRSGHSSYRVQRPYLGCVVTELLSAGVFVLSTCLTKL